MTGRKIIPILSVLFLFLACREAKPPEREGEVAVTEVPVNIVGLPPLPVPRNNPQTPEKIALGKMLYNEKRFSGDGTINCAFCHNPEKTFDDGLPVSKGIRNQRGTRNTPTVLNSAYNRFQFWDGRRNSLEDQARDPFLNPIEHGLTSHDQIVKIVREDPQYVAQFKKVFNVDAGRITIDHVVQAIAAFERTVISGDSPFDRYRYGGDKKALGAAAIRGLQVYLSKGRCQECHMIGEQNAIFTDHKFHNLGVGFKKIESRLQQIIQKFNASQDKKTDERVLSSSDLSELGRYVVSRKMEDIGAFKTPGLRNIVVTGPYMHDGSLKTLEAVVDLYNKGGEKNAFLSGSIRPLNLTAREQADLIAFLKSLTSPQYSRFAR